MDQSRNILSKIISFNKYARYLPQKNRREVWEEICIRNMNMHLKKFPNLKEEIKDVYFNYVIPKKVLPSMRSMQFGGKPIEISNTRIFNCAAGACNSVAFFSEVMHLLLSGCGCFEENTPIITKDGLKNIKDVSLEDEILSFDEKNKNFIWKKPTFSGKTKSSKKKKIKITTENGDEILCTEDHLFLTKNRNWVQAKDLNEYDEIISK